MGWIWDPKHWKEDQIIGYQLQYMDNIVATTDESDNWACFLLSVGILAMHSEACPEGAVQVATCGMTDGIWVRMQSKSILVTH